MKKITYLLFLVSCLYVVGATAGYDDSRLRAEVVEGLDIHAARTTGELPGAFDADGQLGYEVYRTSEIADSGIYDLFVPDRLVYVRAGGGMNIGAASDDEFDGGWLGTLGFGWNASSYVRTELDVEYADYKFDDIRLKNESVGATVYFDLARRWVRSGDITVRRTFVPFIGFGVRGGHYKYQDTDRDDMYFAPMASFGFNFMFTDAFGIDVAYRYQMFVGDHGRNISDVIASVRVNF